MYQLFFVPPMPVIGSERHCVVHCLSGCYLSSVSTYFAWRSISVRTGLGFVTLAPFPVHRFICVYVCVFCVYYIA